MSVEVKPDDSEPSPEREVELRAAYERNVAACRPPYAGCEIRTRGELNWVLQERGWSGNPDRLAKTIDLRESDLSRAVLPDINLGLANLSHARLLLTDLYHAYLHGIRLNGANLGLANLSGAVLSRASLRSAYLGQANLCATILTSTDLGDAFLDNAHLDGATLTTANLSGAYLSGTNLRAANLHAANLSGAIVAATLDGANLTAARMDGATLVDNIGYPVSLDAQTRVLDVAWNGANLAAMQWVQVPRLGDEADIQAATNRHERIKALTDAARAYRGLAKALQVQGVTDPALKYRKRQYQLERRALFVRGKLGSWLFYHLLNLVSGYGDAPGRALACYLAVVGAFGAAYWAITNGNFAFITSHSTHLQWYESLVLSISSFHGRGFFPSVPTLGDPVAIVAAAEAIIGLFIELVFIATFTQRFFAR